MASIVEIISSDSEDADALSEYEGIKAAIRFRVHNAYEDCDLSDADIENRAVLPEANKLIQARVPNWASLGSEKIDRLKDAVIRQAAIEVLLSESKPGSEDSQGEVIMRYDTLKIIDVIKRYENDINSIITEVVPTATNLLVGYFSTSNPKKRF